MLDIGNLKCSSLNTPRFGVAQNFSLYSIASFAASCFNFLQYSSVSAIGAYLALKDDTFLVDLKPHKKTM